MLIEGLLAATLLTYTSDRCGFSFQYPSTWSVAENPKAQVMDPDKFDKLATCGVGLRPPGWRRTMRESDFELSPYPVQITKWNRSFRKSAEETFFTRVSSFEGEGPFIAEDLKPWDWVITGRAGWLVAPQFVTACCQGIRGEAWSRIWGKQNQVGTLWWEAAIVNDRKKHTVVIYAEGFHEVVTQVIDSVRFHSAASAP